MTAPKTALEASNVSPAAPVHIARFNAKYVAHIHTITAYTGFLSALIVGIWLHYTKIVKNSSYGYPDEWFPSVSATIGDLYPERSIFQVAIAITSGPRFVLVFLNFVCAYKVGPKRAWGALISGLLRTLTCGGWVYITSTDDHDFHDIFMISYMVLTIPWTVLVTGTTPTGTFLKKARFITAFAFFAAIVPLVYWFIQHKVHIVAGAYSIYAYFEWALILLDVAFDALSAIAFENIEIVVTTAGALVEFERTVSPAVVVQEKKKKTSSSIINTFTPTEFVVNTINAYTFWTLATSLFLTVWYFPLWYMGLSGWEAVVAVYFAAPFVLVLPPIRKFFTAYPFVARSTAVIIGLGSYKTEDPEKRLLLITVGTAFALIAFVSEVNAYALAPQKLKSLVVSTIVGLLATSVLKFSNYSNNPVWPVMNEENGGWNATGIFIGLAAAFVTPSLKTVSQTRSAFSDGSSFILAALGVGGYFFCLQSYLSDSGTLASWTWEGFPVRGPTAITAALPHFAAVSLGVLASIKISDSNLSGSVWTIGGLLGAFVLYAYPNWTGFSGSLVFVFWLASIGPIIFESASGFNPGLLFFVAFLVDIFISLASIWIVAYAFVPYGPLLRERTDIVLGLGVFTTVLGVLNYRLKHKNENHPLVSVGPLIKQALTILSVLLALSVAITFKRTPVSPHQPFNKDSKSFTTGIWCVHFGLDNDMWSSETRMLNLLREAEVDIVGLLESDTQRLIGGNRDFTQKIAEELGMYVDYGPGPNKHTWGAALLSKFPIIQSSHHLLPSPVGELAPAILATLDIYGEHVDVVVFHSGQEEDIEDRRLQSLGIEELMANSPRPLVLLSYLVTEPLKGNYFTYSSDKLRVHDIDSTDWDRWCEYIMFRDLKKVGYARISRSTITDTELQIAKFKVLDDTFDRDHESLYGNNFVDEEEIDQSLRFPLLFRGDGIRGHRYHVFDEPRYFNQN